MASLVFDVPRYVRSVRGGLREHGNTGEGKGGNGGGNELSGKGVDALFEVRVVVGVKMNMGLGRLVPFLSLLWSFLFATSWLFFVRTC